MPVMRSRRIDVARTAAAAGLFSSWVSPAESEPRAIRRCRSPMIVWLLRMPKNNPSSRCIAIGNHSRMASANAPAGSTNSSTSVIARSVFE